MSGQLLPLVDSSPAKDSESLMRYAIFSWMETGHYEEHSYFTALCKGTQKDHIQECRGHCQVLPIISANRDTVEGTRIN